MLSKLDGSVYCPNCLLKYNSLTGKRITGRIPKILSPCGHTVCQNCISKNEDLEDGFLCPIDQSKNDSDSNLINPLIIGQMQLQLYESRVTYYLKRIQYLKGQFTHGTKSVRYILDVKRNIYY